jgi:hypothetical protein
MGWLKWETVSSVQRFFTHCESFDGVGLRFAQGRLAAAFSRGACRLLVMQSREQARGYKAE